MALSVKVHQDTEVKGLTTVSVFNDGLVLLSERVNTNDSNAVNLFVSKAKNALTKLQDAGLEASILAKLNA